MNSHGFDLLVGVFLFILGLVGSLRKRLSFGLGRDNLASPNLSITLTESRVVLFSRICMVEGAIIVGLWLVAFMGNTALSRWLGVVAGAGLVIAFLVFVGCAFFELSEPLIAKGKKGKKKKISE